MISRCLAVALLAVSLCPSLLGQRPTTGTRSTSDDPATQKTCSPCHVEGDPSGMFTFLKDGEIVQLTLEDGQLSGFLSRYGESDSDKGQFIDQFFDKASLEGDHLVFKTKTVHGLWYEFDGTITVTSGKQLGQEGYRTIRGKLTLHATDAAGHEQASERKVEFKSFPNPNRP